MDEPEGYTLRAGLSTYQPFQLIASQTIGNALHDGILRPLKNVEARRQKNPSIRFHAPLRAWTSRLIERQLTCGTFPSAGLVRQNIVLLRQTSTPTMALHKAIPATVELLLCCLDDFC
jgi:hypothetical protein